MKYCIALLFPFVIFSGCRKEVVAPPEIGFGQYYTVEYQKQENRTISTAAVYNTYNISAFLPAGYFVKVNGRVHDSISTYPNSYVWVDSGLTSASNFVFVKPDGSTITNTAERSMISMVDFSTPLPDTVSRSKGFSFSVTDIPLKESETRIVVIVAENGGFLTRQFDGSTNLVDISANSLSKSSIGELVVSLISIRPLHVPNTDRNAGGTIDLRYRVQKKIWLKD